MGDVENVVLCLFVFVCVCTLLSFWKVNVQREVQIAKRGRHFLPFPVSHVVWCLAKLVSLQCGGQ